MKKLTITLTMVIVVTITAIAQAPQAFRYQAVARDNAGNVLVNQNVSFQISILEGSTSWAAVYVETHDTITNEFGLVNLEIGNGAVVSGVFEEIDWGNGPYFLQIEMDENGLSNYQLMGTSQLLSVPYSLYSESTGDTSRWRKNNDDLFYNNGNIGIGKTTPAVNLDIRSSSISDASRFRLENLDQSNSLFLYSGHETADPYISFKGGDALRFAKYDGGLIELMRITSDGKVGIGTENPSYKFEVEWEPPTSNINPIALFQTTGSTSSSAAVRVQNTSDNFFNFGMTHPGNNNFSIAYNANIGLSTDLMTITPTGNVGIGTTTPAEMLEVAGTIQSNSGGFMFPDGSVQTTAAVGGTGNTLDEAYDQGGAGAGRTIVADAGVVHITGNDGLTVDGDITIMNGHLIIGAASGTDNDLIYFDDTDEGLLWNETEDRFEFTNALLTLGPLQTGSGAPYVAYNRMGSQTPTSGAMTSSGDLYISNDLEVGQNLYAQNDIIVQGEITGTDIVSSTAISNEPGVASRAEDWFNVTLFEGEGISQLLSRTITIPAPGYVLVLGTCEFRYMTAGWQQVDAVIGVSDVNDAFPPSQTFPIRISAAAEKVVFPVNVHGLFDIQTAGAHTFYFLGENTSDTGDKTSITFGDIQFTLLYIPTAYGPVQATNNGIVKNTLEVEKTSSSGMPKNEIAHEKAEAEMFNKTRIQKELNELQYKINSLRDLIEESNTEIISQKFE